MKTQLYTCNCLLLVSVKILIIGYRKIVAFYSVKSYSPVALIKYLNDKLADFYDLGWFKKSVLEKEKRI